MIHPLVMQGLNSALDTCQRVTCGRRWVGCYP